MYLSPISRCVDILSKAVLLLLLLLGLGVLCFVHVCGLALLVLSSLAFRLQKKSKLFNLPLLFLTVSVMGLFLVVLWVGLRYVTMTFPVHTHLHFKIHLRSIRRRREILKFHARTPMVRLGVQTAPRKITNLFIYLFIHVPPGKSQVCAMIGSPMKHYFKK